MNAITRLANEIHEQNVQAGWWEGFVNKIDRHETAMMLVVSELSEAMEGHRKNLMDDHLPQFKMFDVELADALIRLLDLAGAYEMTLEELTIVNITIDLRLLEDKTVPAQLLKIVTFCVTSNPFAAVDLAINGVLHVARLNDVDIFPIIEAKREYNANRADHKRENRDADGGKKY